MRAVQQTEAGIGQPGAPIGGVFKQLRAQIVARFHQIERR